MVVIGQIQFCFQTWNWLPIGKDNEEEFDFAIFCILFDFAMRNQYDNEFKKGQIIFINVT